MTYAERFQKNKVEAELAALIEAFAAERQMSPESFGSMVVDQYQAKQN